MEVQTGEEIERTRDPNQFSYSLREAKLAVVQNFKFNADQQQDIINSLNQTRNSGIIWAANYLEPWGDSYISSTNVRIN